MPEENSEILDGLFGKNKTSLTKDEAEGYTTVATHTTSLRTKSKSEALDDLYTIKSMLNNIFKR